MINARSQIFAWFNQGALRAEQLPAALRAAEVLPTPQGWRRFLDGLALWIGAVFIAASVIFFFAYNWQALSRFAKFGIVETLIVIALGVSWKLGVERMSGKAAVLVATFLVGALLALVGQTYQTGADPWELFAMWALLTLPWVAITRFDALWLFWVGLVNLALMLYYQTFGGLFWLVMRTDDLLWALFIFNTVALCIWEYAAMRGVVWLEARWAARVLASVSGGLITTLTVWAIFESRSVGALAFFAYIGWMAAAYAMYRRRLRDVFVLAGGVLSAVIVITALLSRALLDSNFAGGFLFIGLVVIGLSAVGGLWLKNVATEEAQ